MDNKDVSTKRNGFPPSLTWFIISSLILLRTLIGFHPHSGQSEDHGKEAAYGGDFEAQRHWMEITLHLPISKWYHYDLDYWGLDYPPLTAYVSYLCGYLSNILVGPESVSLDESRGIEDPLHKSFMRGTVLFLDVVVYFSAVWAIAKRLYPKSNFQFFWLVIVALTQPAIILIDHGHFQYNTVALGLSLWSFHFMTKGSSFSNCVWGSFLFCMSLNFKQMTLYFAPAVFMYLLGRCFVSRELFLFHFSLLAVTVISSFALLWWPFFVYPYEDIISGIKLSPTQNAIHVLRRLFPFQRGLFEGKVSNLWCALSTKPISIRTRIPTQLQPILALILTLVLIMPLCMKLFQIGFGFTIFDLSLKDGKRNHLEQGNRHLKLLLLGSTASGLSFFLASFQVHEKSILMAVSTISLLFIEYPSFVSWFSIVAVWTLWPLLTVDKLRLAYITSTGIFIAIIWLFPFSTTIDSKNQPSFGMIPGVASKLIYPLFVFFSICLHLAELSIQPPQQLPDLYPVLWSVVGCGFFCWSWIFTSYLLFKKII